MNTSTQSDTTPSIEIDFEVAIKQSPFMLFNTIALYVNMYPRYVLFFTKLLLMIFDLKKCHTVYITKGMFVTYSMCHFGYHICPYRLL